MTGPGNAAGGRQSGEKRDFIAHTDRARWRRGLSAQADAFTGVKANRKRPAAFGMMVGVGWLNGTAETVP